MNYYEKLGKLYHQLMVNENKYNTTPKRKGKNVKHSFKQYELKRKIETIMAKELHKDNPNVIGVCNIRSASVNYVTQI